MLLSCTIALLIFIFIIKLFHFVSKAFFAKMPVLFLGSITYVFTQSQTSLLR